MNIIILARSGSKRIPKKNYLIELTPGQSLLSLCIKKGLEISPEVTVSSDSKLVLKLAENEGAKTIMSPHHEDASTSVEAVLFWVEQEKITGAILLLQLTSPLVTAEDIQGAIKKFNGNRISSPLVTAEDIREAVEKFDGNPIFAAREIKQGFQIWDSHNPLFPGFQGVRSQDLPPAYLPCGAFYIITVEKLKKTKSFMAGATPYGIPEEKAIDIDTQEDLEFARWKFLQTWNPER